MRYLWMAVIFTFIGCSGISPQNKPVVNAVYQFGVLKLIKANPALKPKLQAIISDAQDALNSHSVITRAAAAQWISTEINSKIGNAPDAQLLLQIVLSQYMPDWSNTTLNVISAQQRADLQDAINLTTVTLAMVP